MRGQGVAGVWCRRLPRATVPGRKQFDTARTSSLIEPPNPNPPHTRLQLEYLFIHSTLSLTTTLLLRPKIHSSSTSYNLYLVCLALCPSTLTSSCPPSLAAQKRQSQVVTRSSNPAPATYTSRASQLKQNSWRPHCRIRRAMVK